jgi:hypothetical protein
VKALSDILKREEQVSALTVFWEAIYRDLFWKDIDLLG